MHSLSKLKERERFFSQSRWLKLARCPGRMITSYMVEGLLTATGRTRRVTAETFWGDEMTVLLPEAVSTAIHRYGFFEAQLSHMVCSYLKPGMVFFDVGAHFGYYSLLGSTLVGETGAVHAFEPTPSTRDILALNVGSRSNVTICDRAAWSEMTTLRLKDYGTKLLAFNTLGTSRLPPGLADRSLVQEIPVETVCLSDYVRGSAPVPHLVKIDVENGELQVLAGMHQLLTNEKPALAIELGDFGESSDSHSASIVSYLARFGYSPYELHDGAWRKHNPIERYPFINLLFVADGSWPDRPLPNSRAVSVLSSSA